MCMRANLTAIVLLLTCSGLAYAQVYPVKAVRIIVPFAPGGPNDLAVRPVAQKLYEFLGQPFVIDYRAGANGIIGCDLVAKSAPDGYTMVVISSSFSINSSSYAKLPFDPIRDFTPVGSLATSDIIFVVNPTVPVKSVREFVALAKADPGKVRVLAIASARRARALPDAPTFAESGYPEVQVDTRYGLLAPAATPSATIARLEAAIAKALATPEVREQYAALSLDPAPLSAQDSATYLRDEILRWRKVVIAAKLQPQ